MKPRAVLVCLLALATRLVVACDDDVCDEGEILRTNYCMCDETRGYVQSKNGQGYGCELKKTTPPKPVADGGTDGGGGGGVAFGDVCTTGGGECAEPAPFCAVQPGMAEGYCTIEGCKDDASVCPEGWNCLLFTTAGFCAKP